MRAFDQSLVNTEEHTLIKSLSTGLTVALFFSASAEVNILTYHNDNFRSGANLSETILTPGNVNTNTFGKLFQYSLDGCVYAQPLYVSSLAIPGRGTHNVVFVATEHNSVYAFDADSSTGAGGLLWQTNLGPSAATPNNDFGLRFGGFETIVPEVGITGTPVIDLSSGTLYVDAFTHEGTTYFHRIHGLNIATGQERPFSPVLVSASVNGAGVGGNGTTVQFDAKQQLQRAALTLSGGLLYAPYSGYDDSDPYHGWVIGFNATNLHALPSFVFNTTPNATPADFGTNAGEGGIWMAGCGPAADTNGSLYFATGNGSFNAVNNSGGTEYADSFLRLSTSGGLSVADYFTPYNQDFLAGHTLDAGSGGVLLLPDQPGPFPHLMLGGSKTAKLYLINRDMMTVGNNHFNEGGNADAVAQTIPLGGPIQHTPAYFNGRVYTAASGDVPASFPLVAGQLQVGNYQAAARTLPYPGATPVISANGTNNGIVWLLQCSSPALLLAYDATNLTNELYNSAQAGGGRDQLPDGIRFAVPIVVNGKVFVATQYALSVLGLLSPPTPYQLWCAAHFGTNAANPDIAGPRADPDHDGIINLFEYAFASDPNHYDPAPPVSGGISSNSFCLRFKRNMDATDVTYSIEIASQLNNCWTAVTSFTQQTGWTTNTAWGVLSESSPSGSPPDEYVNVTLADTATVTSSTGHFFRVQVSASR